MTAPHHDGVAGVRRGPGPPWFRRLLAAGAALYLAGIFLEVVGAPLHRFVPRPLHYFLQVAKLFPHALSVSTEFRAEAYSCADHVFRELDARPFFQIRPNDKENRFERALFFYRREPVVMRALDEYLVTASNRSGAPIGGVMFLSLRIPIPRPGQVFERYRRKPLGEYPAEYRKIWYQTPTSLRRGRCHEGPEGDGPASP